MSDRIAEIEARLQAATPGPWEINELGYYTLYRCNVFVEPNVCGFYYVTNDVPFIANAPSDIRYLLDENKRLQFSHRESGHHAHRERRAREEIMIYRTTAYTVKCFGCNTTLDCSFAQTKREAKQFFKGCDWVFYGERSYCPNCSARELPTLPDQPHA